MKINAGEFKYRKLAVPEGIRPTTEKVREAVFSMIQSYTPDAVVFDLFAGSGALGLEALSRGASQCIFNEGNRRNYRVLLENIKNCKAESRSKALNYDFRKALLFPHEKVDILFVDPPYASGYYEEIFETVAREGLLSEDGIIVAEHLYDNPLSVGDDYECLKSKRYGTIAVEIFRLR